MADDLAIVAKTGIVGDYINEYFHHEYTRILDGMEGLADSIKRIPIKKYEERFSPTENENLVNDQNRVAVSRLDEITDKVNSQFIDPNNFTLNDWKLIFNEVSMLIYADKTRIYFKDIGEILEQ